MSTKFRNIFEGFGYDIPVIPDYDREDIKSKADVLRVYSSETDKAAVQRQIECAVRYMLTGVWEGCHRLGEADVVVKSGMTVEVKCGHGSPIEPGFRSQESLIHFLDVRSNPMLKASHVAYFPARATSIEDAYDVLFFTAQEFFGIMDSFGKLQMKENRGKWGVIMKPWIAEGYAQKSSAKKDALIREALYDKGLSLWEFAQKFNIQLHDL